MDLYIQLLYLAIAFVIQIVVVLLTAYALHALPGFREGRAPQRLGSRAVIAGTLLGCLGSLLVSGSVFGPDGLLVLSTALLPIVAGYVVWLVYGRPPRGA